MKEKLRNTALDEVSKDSRILWSADFTELFLNFFSME